MNLADVFTVTFLILGFVAVLVAYWLFAGGLFPEATERAAERFGRGPVRFALLGLVTLLPLIVVGLRLVQRAPTAGLKIAGLAVVLLPVLGALFGSAGLALRLGHGLPSARDSAEPWRRTLRGGVVLGLCVVLPVLGTFLVLPYVLLTGFGVFLAGVFARTPALAVPPLPAAKLEAAPEAVALS